MCKSVLLMVVLTLGVLACAAPVSFAHLTSLGIYYVDDTGGLVSPQEIDKVARCVLEIYDVPLSALYALSVRMIHDTYCPCWDSEEARSRQPYGCYMCEHNTLQVAYFSGRGWAETFKHELKHWIMDINGGICDGEHTSAIWQDILICSFEGGK